MLCHSPQERLFIGGGWREGLLPPIEALPAPSARRRWRSTAPSARPIAACGDDDALRDPDRALALERSRSMRSTRITFAAWLDAQGLVAPALRWYLDYCCRDDYGAGSADVSAWAGMHYFASRHGFHAPGDEARGGDSGEGLLTWPEGNGWLAERLAAPLGDRLHGGRVVLAVEESRDEVAVDAWNVATAQRERWIAARIVLAAAASSSPRDCSRRRRRPWRKRRASLRHAPWLVANLQLDAALDDRPGAPLSWDNVAYGSARPGLCRCDAPEHAAVRRTDGAHRLPGRSAAAATPRVSSNGARCSATTGAPGPAASSPTSRRRIPTSPPSCAAST